MMEMQHDTVRRRVVDRSNGEARRAVAATVALFGAWRSDVARFGGWIERSYTEADRSRMLARCREVEREIHAARIGLIEALADAPRQVAGHSRVVDVERALDNIAQAVAALRHRLTQ